jgi:hypothetical protein
MLLTQQPYNQRANKDMYHIEQEIVDRENIISNLIHYVETKESNQELHIVEEKIFAQLQALGLVLVKQVVSRRENELNNKLAKDASKPLWPPRHGTKPKQYVSIFGPLTIERSYFWEQGKRGTCPLDSELNLPENSYSYLLQKWIQSGIAENPYEQTTQSLGDLLNINLPASTQQIVARSASEDFSDYYKQKNVHENSEGEILIATADCKGVAMVPSERPSDSKSEPGKIRRGKGDKKKGLRKDATVVSDYSINPETRRADEVIDGLMSVNGEKALNEYSNKKKRTKIKNRQPINKHVSACMKGKTLAIKDLADRLQQRNPTSDKKILVLIDGERALKNRIEEEFARRGWEPRVVGYCLDIVHALEYLWDASTALYGERSPERIVWVHRKTLDLLDGHVGRVINGLKQTINKSLCALKNQQKTVLKSVIGYFENHKDMMNYDKYLRQGLPIATGIIEGACSSLVKDRTDRSGMKWTKSGAQAVLNLRSLKRNRDWESYWIYHIDLVRERLYAKPKNLAA